MFINCKKTTHCTAWQSQLSFVNHRLEICRICITHLHTETKFAASLVMSVLSKASTWAEHTAQLFSRMWHMEVRSQVFSLRRLLKLRSAVAVEAVFTSRSFMYSFSTGKKSCTAGCKFHIIWIASAVKLYLFWWRNILSSISSDVDASFISG